jgi:flavorubredoxin
MPFLEEKIGGIVNLSAVFLSHQDPDLTANLPSIMSQAPESILLTSIDTWRLVKMYGIPDKRVNTVEKFSTKTIKVLKTGHRLSVVPARYCHFRGSMMLYDLESKILFSGDFLGGVDTRKGEGIYADEDSWEGIALFHQLYMPSTVALKHTIERISMLDPFPEVIAPQHGDIIKGEFIHKFIGRLSSLTVGAELISEADDQGEKTLQVINSFLAYLKENHSQVASVLENGLRHDVKFASPVIFKDGKAVQLKVSPTVTLQQIIHLIRSLQSEMSPTFIQSIFMEMVKKAEINFYLDDEDE